MSKPKSERKLTLPARTARLNLREFVKSDFDAIYAYSSDPRVTRYLFFGPRDRESTADYLEGLLASQVEVPRTRFELAVEEIESGRVIGACDLSLIEHNVVDLGYMLGLADWGKGYATEIALALVDAAFFDLQADRIISTVDVNNRASIHVLEAFMYLEKNPDTTKLTWMVGIFVVFVIALLMVAIADRIGESAGERH